jgi:hypothetical protein
VETVPVPLAHNVSVVGAEVTGGKNRPLLGPAPIGAIFNERVPLRAMSVDAAIVVNADFQALQPPLVVSNPSL